MASMAAAFLPSFSSFSQKPSFNRLSYYSLSTPPPSRQLLLVSTARAVSDNGPGFVNSSSTLQVKEEVEEKKNEEKVKGSSLVGDLSSNGAPPVAVFEEPRWIGGTWDLKQFKKGTVTDWDALIDAEVKRRKWFEDNPESTSFERPVVFDTSIIPWWAWVKRFHLPEAELLNGRAAMVGFFAAYFVDSLTGLGLVDQMGNFFCKFFLFVSVVGVLVIRKNEDLETLKNLIQESTFYDKQWQAAWKDDPSNNSKKD